jgi:uncharacterized protein YjhX (UPF0386 family)
MKRENVRDPDVGEVVASLPDGYRLVCTRCAVRNGFHHRGCQHPAARKIKEKQK